MQLTFAHLCLPFLLFASALAAPIPKAIREVSILPRAAGDATGPAKTVQTTTQTLTGGGTVTQVCVITLTPIEGADGKPAVREEKTCTISMDGSNQGGSNQGGGSSQPQQASTATQAQATSAAPATKAETTSAAPATTSSPAAATSSAAAPATTSSAAAPATTSSAAASTSSAAAPATSSAAQGGASSSAAAPAASSAVSPVVSVAGASTVKAADLSTIVRGAPATTAASSVSAGASSASAPAASVTAPAGGAASGATTAGSTTATSAADQAASASSGSASVSATAAAAFQLPGKKLSVLPIGLGVFAGISVIALIVVGLVTYERTKYRKAFRQRKLAEAGAQMGYGGMAQRA